MAVVATMFAACSNDDNDNLTPDGDEITFDDGIISGNIDRDAHVKAGQTYVLKGEVYVKSGATLTIDPGVTIQAETGDKVPVAFLAIERGAKINAVGTADKPIIFTSQEKVAGKWGGLVICGNATNGKGANAQAEVAGLNYGGDDDTDNSGTLSHLIVEYSGNLINNDSEFNAITFYAVGSGTKVDNIYINQVADDGIEFFGGTVNVENAVVIGSQDDSFDWTDGWRGTAMNIYADQSKATTYSSDSRGIEADNFETNFAQTPISSPTLTNVTLIGRNKAEVTSEAGMKLRRGTQGKISNVYLKDFIAGKGVDVSDNESIEYFKANPVQKVKFDNVPTKGAVEGTYTEDDTATGAGNGAELPEWASWATSFLD